MTSLHVFDPFVSIFHSIASLFIKPVIAVVFPGVSFKTSNNGIYMSHHTVYYQTTCLLFAMPYVKHIDKMSFISLVNLLFSMFAKRNL